jgi:hypothetical protein
MSRWISMLVAAAMCVNTLPAQAANVTPLAGPQPVIRHRNALAGSSPERKAAWERLSGEEQKQLLDNFEGLLKLRVKGAFAEPAPDTLLAPIFESRTNDGTPGGAMAVNVLQNDAGDSRAVQLQASEKPQFSRPFVPVVAARAQAKPQVAAQRRCEDCAPEPCWIDPDQCHRNARPNNHTDSAIVFCGCRLGRDPGRI